MLKGFAGGLDGKEAVCNEGNPFLIPGLRRSPGEGNGLHTLVFLPGEFHGQRSLASYTPWGHKELDTTEGLTLFLFSIHSVDFSGDNFKANLNLF